MLTLYAVLIGLDATLGAILAAVLFAYVQLVSAAYSFRTSRMLLTDWPTWVFGVAWVGAILLAGFGVFAQGIARADWTLTAWGVDFVYVTSNGRYALIAAIASVAVVVIFLCTVRSYASRTTARRVLEWAKTRATGDALRCYCRGRHGLPEPPNPDIIRFHLLASIQTREANGEDGDEMRIPIPDAEQIGKAEAEAVRRAGQAQSRYDSLMAEAERHARAGRAEDPVTPISAVACKALTEHDLSTFRMAMSAQADMVSRWIHDDVVADSISSQQDWDPDSALAEQCSHLLAEHMQFVREACIAGGHSPLAREVCSTVKRIGMLAAARRDCQVLLQGILQFSREFGADAIERGDGEGLRVAVEALVDLGIENASHITEERRHAFDEACGALGWLAEKLVLRGLDPVPFMRIWEYQDPAGHIANGLYHLGAFVRKHLDRIYPTVFVAACSAFLRRMCDIYSDDWKHKEHMRDGVHEIAQVGITAAKLGHGQAVHMCVSNLRDLYERLAKSSDDHGELLSDIGHWIAEIAAWIVTSELDPSRGTRVDPTSLLEETLGDMKTEHVAYAMMELVIHSNGYGGDWDAIWGLIKRVGMRQGSNFDLNFDPRTGEDGP